MAPHLPVLGITMGDPAGVGPEIIARALARPAVTSSCRPVVIGDRSVMAATLELLHSPLELHAVGSPAECRFAPGAVECLDLGNVDAERLRKASVSAEAGRAAKADRPEPSLAGRCAPGRYSGAKPGSGPVRRMDRERLPELRVECRATRRLLARGAAGSRWRSRRDVGTVGDRSHDRSRDTAGAERAWRIRPALPGVPPTRDLPARRARGG